MSEVQFSEQTTGLKVFPVQIAKNVPLGDYRKGALKSWTLDVWFPRTYVSYSPRKLCKITVIWLVWAGRDIWYDFNAFMSPN